ncbi:MAG: hypothetical protein HOV76_07915 [Hamadaea sp.]|nr:hypothetical protein [Hamadaea sp.]
MATYRDDVAYVEHMRPERIMIGAEEFHRVARLIASAQPTFDEVRQKVEWEGTARELFDRRLREADLILDALSHSYEKAGRALDDYRIAQRTAIDLVIDGVARENQLADLLRGEVTEPGPQPMRRWEDLRSKDGVLDWFSELGERDDVDRVRAEADRLYHEASDLYARARKTENDARSVAVAAIDMARRDLPDFQADAGHAQAIISSVPGLREEIHQAARDPNARRPGLGVLLEYQVEADADQETYLGLTLSGSERRVLRERATVEVAEVYAVREAAFAEAQKRFPNTFGEDDHQDAFRHAYASALLTQTYGEDWAERFTTAHETGPNNPGTREAMDLYNNEAGRTIALEHPDATPDQLADLVQQSVRDGQMVVVGPDKKLDFSDTVRPLEGDFTDRATLPGHPQRHAGDPLP